jgi:two-component system chemotaxis response regulator CheB
VTVRCVIVEDSPFQREYLRDKLSEDPRIEVVGAYSKGEELLEAVAFVRPDVVTMDAHLPGMSGPETVHRLLRLYPVPVVLFSASASFWTPSAEEAGVVSVVDKGISAEPSEEVLAELRNQVIIMSQVKVFRRRDPREVHRSSGSTWRFLALGASSGSPQLIELILRRLVGRDLACFVVQHLPEEGVENFARWLHRTTGWEVEVACSGAPIATGKCYVAPHGRHMEVGHYTVSLTDSRRQDGHCPSASRLFQSLALSHPTSTVGVILSGMGRDGAQGLLELRQAGGWTLSQSSASAGVSSMPKAAEDLGAVCESYSVSALVTRLERLFPQPLP